jgi:hypothetical protein
MQEMMARMEINQAKLEADRKADQGHMQDMLTRMDTNTKAMQEDIKTNQAKMDVNLKEMMEEIHSIWLELKEKRMAERKADQEKREAERKVNREVAIRLEATDLKENPEEMECVSEHWEVPKEDAIVKPVKGRKKRHSGQKLAAWQHGESKELTRGDCESQRKLAATCRNVSCRAGVAQRKINFFRKIQTWGYCESWKRVTATRIKMTQSVKMAWRRGHDHDRYNQGIVAEETWKGQMENRRRKCPQCNNGITDRDLRQQANKEPRHKTTAAS